MAEHALALDPLRCAAGIGRELTRWWCVSVSAAFLGGGVCVVVVVVCVFGGGRKTAASGKHRELLFWLLSFSGCLTCVAAPP